MVSLVYLVCLAHLVSLVNWFVWFVSLFGPNQLNRQDKPNKRDKPNKPDRLAELLHNLLGRVQWDNTALMGCQCSEPARRVGLARQVDLVCLVYLVYLVGSLGYFRSSNQIN